MAVACSKATGTRPPMKMIDRKSKMVSFRLSPEEYRQLRDACSSHGVRSISELARTAMQSLVTTDGHPAPLHQQLQELRDRLNHLCHEVDRLKQGSPDQISACATD